MSAHHHLGSLLFASYRLISFFICVPRFSPFLRHVKYLLPKSGLFSFRLLISPYLSVTCPSLSLLSPLTVCTTLSYSIFLSFISSCLFICRSFLSSHFVYILVCPLSYPFLIFLYSFSSSQHIHWLILRVYTQWYSFVCKEPENGTRYTDATHLTNPIAAETSLTMAVIREGVTED